MIKKILISYILSFLVFYPVAFADEEITTLKKGDTAPFDGTLFNTEAAARLLIDLEFTQASCKVEIDRQLGIQSSQMQLQIDTLNSSLTTCNQKYDDILKIKNDQILFLDDQLKRANPDRSAVLFSAGIVSGIALSILTTYAISQTLD